MPLPPMPAPPQTLQVWLETTPVWITGLSGGLLLLAGGRLYKLAILAPGILGGVAAAMMLPASLGPVVIAIAAVVLAAAGALICHLLERVAVHVIGAIAVAGVVQLAWPLAVGQPTPWWGMVVAAALGLLLFPSVFRGLIKWITALLGALMLAWSIGEPENLWVVGGLFLGGCIVQGATGKRKPRKEDG